MYAIRSYYAIMTGLTSLSLFMMHGAIYLILKTEGRLFAKLTLLLKKSVIFFIVIFSITTLYTLIYIPHLSDKFASSNKEKFAIKSGIIEGKIADLATVNAFAKS